MAFLGDSWSTHSQAPALLPAAQVRAYLVPPTTHILSLGKWLPFNSQVRTSHSFHLSRHRRFLPAWLEGASVSVFPLSDLPPRIDSPQSSQGTCSELE